MIYEPQEDSYLLAEQVKKYAFGTVLDIGSGSGMQAQTAAVLKSVKKVTAVDVAADVLSFLKKQKRQKKLSPKISVLKSNLFSNVKGRFDTIIFNPPYLPVDEREPLDSRNATTGGKHGYETLRDFFYGLNDHLTKKGICLVVFSSLTKKEKVDAFIDEIGYNATPLAEQAIGGFETLYVYKLTRNKILADLFSKNITQIRQFAKGKRGVLYKGVYKRMAVAIKAQRPDVSVHSVELEATLIPLLNKKGIAPQFLFKGTDYFCYAFVPGELVKDFLKHGTKQQIKKVLLTVLLQCRMLDMMKISKEEMQNPYKHIVVGKKIVLVDFERARKNPYPQNVTQFCQYIMRNKPLLQAGFNNAELIALTKEYKSNQSQENFRKIKTFLERI